MSSLPVFKARTANPGSPTGSFVETTPSGSWFEYRANEPSYATLYFQKAHADGVFARRDQVEIYIDATRMFRGYVDDILSKKTASDERLVVLKIVNWADWLAAKRVFEKQYWRTTNARQIFIDSAAKVTDGTHTLSGAGVSASLTQSIKREYFATMVKDAWRSAGEIGDAEYFGDDSRVLQAFVRGANRWQTGGANFKLVDYKPTLAKERLVDIENFDLEYGENVTQEVKEVIATTGVAQTYPAGDINKTMQAVFWNDLIGKHFSHWFSLGTSSEYHVNITSIKPIEIDPGDTQLNVDGIMFNVVQVNWASAGTTSILSFRPTRYTGSVSDMKVALGSFQELRFFIKNGLSPAVGSITLRLDQDGLNSFSRTITAHLNGTDWTFLKYDLPDGSNLNGWTQNGTPTEINSIKLEFRTAGGSLIGFTGNVKLSWFHLFGRRRVTVTAAGSPATQKIIVDKSTASNADLMSTATKEQARLNAIAKRGQATLNGDVAWKWIPGYLIDVDFTRTLGAFASATDIRIDNIRHFLWNGLHKMTINFNNAYQRA